MIIGISGKIGSGKDTVGSIIQYLTSQHILAKGKLLSTIMTYKEFSEEFKTHNYIESNWQVKKFAYKLKQIVSILTGCTIEDLENQEFKNKSLPDEWRKYYSKPSNNRPFDEAILIDKETFYKSLETGVIVHYRYRDLLQKIGTDALRDVIHPDIWVNALFSEYKFEGCKNTGKRCETPNGDCNSNHCYPNWIITDMRFSNELKAVKDRSGISIRVNRYLNYSDIDKINFNKFAGEHSSETALDNAKFDYTIDNNGTIKELISKVKEILIKEKII